MFLEPRIQVNAVVDAAATEFDVWYVEGREERDSDSEIRSSLLFVEQPRLRKSQRVARHSICLHAAAKS